MTPEDRPHEPATMGISGYVVVPKSVAPARVLHRDDCAYILSCREAGGDEPNPAPACTCAALDKREERVRAALRAAHACSSPREVKAVLALLEDERRRADNHGMCVAAIDFETVERERDYALHCEGVERDQADYWRRRADLYVEEIKALRAEVAGTRSVLNAERIRARP